jgi:hypothetical protein
MGADWVEVLTFEEIFPLSKNIWRHLEAMSELVIEDPECLRLSDSCYRAVHCVQSIWSVC